MLRSTPPRTAGRPAGPTRMDALIPHVGGRALKRLFYASASNVFTGSPTPALHESWGSLKSRFAPKSTPAPGTPTDR